MEKTEVVAASAEEGASVVKDCAQVQEKEEVVTATEAEAARVEEQISIVVEGDAKRTQGRVFEPEAALAVEQEPLGSFMGATTVEPGAVASEAPGDPIMAMSGETSELIEEVVGEVASVEEKEALVTAIVEESWVEAAEIAPTMEIVEESSVEAEPAPKVEILEEVAVIPGEEGEAVVEPEAALAVEEPEFRVPPKHAVFLSFNGEQKDFVRRLGVALEGRGLHPFIDLSADSLPIGEPFGVRIFDAIKECHVGVVILSERFFTSKWCMMELAAMHDRVLKGRSSFIIVPVFFSSSRAEIMDGMNHNRWLSCWHENLRAVQVDKFEAAVKFLSLVNGFVYDHTDALRSLKMIVDEICKITPPLIEYEDSSIAGRARLCTVIREKINMQLMNNIYEVCVVGLYGIAGIGKTTMCKALCNEFFSKFHGNVCHVEFGSCSDEELLRHVLQRLSNTPYEMLNNFDENELRKQLKEGIIKDAVFLALDNLSDASIMEARRYLFESLPSGSIVMVTSRSKGSLLLLSPYMEESNCLKMPELTQDEAKSLFLKASHFVPRNESDVELVMATVETCRFTEHDGTYYHPLALSVLGRQLGSIDKERWRAQLRMLDDMLNRSSETEEQPVFSILRKSFVSLRREEQLMVMDVALYLPKDYQDRSVYNVCEWLGMVHGLPRGGVMRVLETLETKSLVEILVDGGKTSIGMHDLWREFCVRESKFEGDLSDRRWFHVTSDFSHSVVPAGKWEDVKRMAFFDPELGSLGRVKFADFPNVTALKITGVCVTKKTVLDLSRLIHLKSLELSGKHLHRLVLRGLPKGLLFIALNSDFSCHQVSLTGDLEYHWKSVDRANSWQLLNDLGWPKELQCLTLVGYEGSVLPEIRGLLSLREAVFINCRNVVFLNGLSSKLTNLRVLDLRGCTNLRGCRGVGDLVNLEELNCQGCNRLVRLPNLRRLGKLRILNISGCRLIGELPGLDDLGALEELHAGGAPSNYSGVFKLPNMRNLIQLRVLCLRDCRLDAAPGLGELIALQEIVADFRALRKWPELKKLRMLQKIEIDGWNSEGLSGLKSLVMLDTLYIGCCAGVDKLPDLQRLTRLQTLVISKCEFKDVSSLSTLSTLKNLGIRKCNKLEKLDAKSLPILDSLVIRDCAKLRSVNLNMNVAEHCTDWFTLRLSSRFSESPDMTLRGCLEDTATLTADLFLKMKILLGKVKLWHNQCSHFLEQYAKAVPVIKKLLCALMEVEQGLLDPPKIKFICSKMICCMLEGKELLLFCGENRHNRAAFALSSPRSPSAEPYSRFAVILRELEWTLDLVSFVEHKMSTLDDWEWCEERCRLKYVSGDFRMNTEDNSLESDVHRQNMDREAFLKSLKPVNSPCSSQASSKGVFFMSWFIQTLHGLLTGPRYQDELEDIWRKRLLSSTFDTTPSSSPALIHPGSYIDKLDHLRVVKDLATGNYKSVKVCEWLGESVAVAVLDNPSLSALEDEVRLLARAQHPNVVELVGYAYKEHDRDPKGFLLTELMEQDLDSLISELWCGKTSKGFVLPVAIDIVLQIVEAMIHLKERRVIHRDLKPKNILASRKYTANSMLNKYCDIPVYYNIKLIDFGTAKLREQDSFCYTRRVGTSYYRAPEVYDKSEEESPYTWSADVYSFGMTCYEVFTGKRPFLNETDVWTRICNGERPKFPQECPSFIQRIIECCWDPNPDCRPTFEDIRRELWQFKLYASI